MTTLVAETPPWDHAALQAQLPKHMLTGSMRYSDFEKIGYGGKAEVFRCRDVTLGREVAFKVLHQSLLDVTLEQQMLAREARIMATLDHPMVPTIHDLGRDQHYRPYFTMALADGQTFYEVLEGLEQGSSHECQEYNLVELITLVLRVGEALHEIHRQGVIHGDIKPENLVVDRKQDVCILDWGLARLLDDSEHDEERLEAQWGRQGSPLYMSPEQVAGESFLSPASDIYSLGVVLYELLALDSPLKGASSRETFKLVETTDPEPPSAVAPDRLIPRELDEVCLRALAKAPDERFPSMEAFCDSLRDCQLDLLIRYERDSL